MPNARFVTAVNCMDGRVQEPVNNWLKEQFNADFVDVITEPGPDRILSGRESAGSASIKERVLVSVNCHGSSVVAMVAHHDCAGNLVGVQEHLQLLADSVEIILSWNLGVRVIGLWIGSDWQVEKIHDRLE